MSQHTSGPFTPIRTLNGWLIVADSPKGRVEVATVHDEAEYSPLPAEANAHLLAAAPVMLDLLRRTAGLDIGGEAGPNYYRWKAEVDDFLTQIDGAA